MVLLGCFVAQTRGVMFARDNLIFVRKPCNLFDLSCMKVGLSWTGVYTLLGVFRSQSYVYYKSVRDSDRKCSVFLHIMQLLRNICDITMKRR